MDAVKPKTGSDEDFIAAAREKFQRASKDEEDNRRLSLDDHKFSRLGEQWDDELRKQREEDGRPCLVINHHPAFIRQVVNSARQSKPAIQVVPADSKADPETAEIMSGLVRNIEVASDADIAYDTAVENAVAGGFGYFRINLAYTSDDSFDKDISIEPVPDPFTVYGDPDSEAPDGSDWNCCFVIKRMHKDAFAEQYKGKESVDWTDLKDLGSPWFEDDHVAIAEYWLREQVDGKIIALSDDTVVSESEYAERAEEYAMFGIEPVGAPRAVKTHKVTQYIMSGVEVLETVEWPGRWIPIVPVYGESMVIEGKRHYKSLVRDAKDPQREHNYWRSAAAESVALAPRTPFIGEDGAFDTDIEKWTTANHASHAFIAYKKGSPPPQRQPYVGPPAGELQQAGMAADDMKTIIGLYSPNLGERSGSDSGIAIRSLQRQGDVGTFHFLDNLSRSIRFAGRIIIDLIAKVYTTPRMLRVLGENMEPQQVQAAPAEMQQEIMAQMQARGQAISRVYDLTAGKYDLVVRAGPSFGTQREFARAEIVEIIRAFPDSAPILGPMFLENSDWPGADEAAEQLKAMTAPQQQDPQQSQQMQAMMQQAQEQMAQLAQENEALKQQAAAKAKELDIRAFEAVTKRLEVQAKAQNDALGHQVDAASAALQARQSNPFTMDGTL
jgi:hypothetical protein